MDVCKTIQKYDLISLFKKKNWILILIIIIINTVQYRQYVKSSDI